MTDDDTMNSTRTWGWHVYKADGEWVGQFRSQEVAQAWADKGKSMGMYVTQVGPPKKVKGQ
jgi:hypothetical protein